MQFRKIAKSIWRDSTILFIGCSISFSLLFSLSAYTGKDILQEELLELTFSSWTPEQKKPEKTEKMKQHKEIKREEAKSKKKVIKTKEKPIQKKVILSEKIIEEQESVIQEGFVDPVEPEKIPSEELLPEPTPVFQLTNMPRFLHKNTPVYPSHLKNIGKEGIVKLQLLIDEKGNVRKIYVLKSAGDGFDNAAMRAMYKSTFIPAKVNEKSVAVLLTMPVKFRLM